MPNTRKEDSRPLTGPEMARKAQKEAAKKAQEESDKQRRSAAEKALGKVIHKEWKP